MVFYGKVSKGCQRCRQRKVKCDAGRPGCLRCEKLGTPCPGYRDLSTVLFRDERERVIRNVHKQYDELQVSYDGWGAPRPSAEDSSGELVQRCPAKRRSVEPGPQLLLSPSLGVKSNDMAAGFFFRHYSFTSLPTTDAKGCDAWLSRCYAAGRTDDPLRAAVEAAGLAGMHNVTGSKSLSALSKERYGNALAGIKSVLTGDTMPSDSTVMTVMLLGLFEYITFDSSDGLNFWSTHIQGAIALLQKQGPTCFTSTLGQQLLKQASGQMLYVLMQQAASTPAPAGLVRLRREFEHALAKERKNMRPGPLTNLCFELLSLRAAMRDKTMTNEALSDSFKELDTRVGTWPATVPDEWSFFELTAEQGGLEPRFEGATHIYQDTWAAQSWNNYRSVRILVNRSRVDLASSTGAVSDPAALSQIRNMSADICKSASQFVGSPRTISLIWPLSLVATEQGNSPETRLWAAEQLGRISAEMGIRQPRMVADGVTKELKAMKEMNIVYDDEMWRYLDQHEMGATGLTPAD